MFHATTLVRTDLREQYRMEPRPRMVGILQNVRVRPLTNLFATLPEMHQLTSPLIRVETIQLNRHGTMGPLFRQEVSVYGSKRFSVRIAYGVWHMQQTPTAAHTFLGSPYHSEALYDGWYSATLWIATDTEATIRTYHEHIEQQDVVWIVPCKVWFNLNASVPSPVPQPVLTNIALEIVNQALHHYHLMHEDTVEGRLRDEHGAPDTSGLRKISDWIQRIQELADLFNGTEVDVWAQLFHTREVHFSYLEQLEEFLHYLPQSARASVARISIARFAHNSFDRAKHAFDHLLPAARNSKSKLRRLHFSSTCVGFYRHYQPGRSSGSRNSERFAKAAEEAVGPLLRLYNYDKQHPILSFHTNIAKYKHSPVIYMDEASRATFVKAWQNQGIPVQLSDHSAG